MSKPSFTTPLNISSLVVTGGCGFIGSNFIRLLLSDKKELQIINIDALTYAGNKDNISDFTNNPNHIFVKGDIRDKSLISNIFGKYSPDAVVNFAAESHVDRSIDSPQDFFETNVGGTLNLLNNARENGVKRYLQVSTDEVYGSLGSKDLFTEESLIQPNSPYSASKASADHFVRAFHKTYGMDTVITRCSNNYGPYQFPEKLIPLVISNIKNNVKIPVYGDGSNIRDWIHVDDHCMGIWEALTNGKSGHVYNFGGNNELDNLTLIKKILNIMQASESLIDFVKDRKGHDYRYAIDNSKAKKVLGWSPSIVFENGIKLTVEWYQDNISWLESVSSGAYLNED